MTQYTAIIRSPHAPGAGLDEYSRKHRVRREADSLAQALEIFDDLIGDEVVEAGEGLVPGEVLAVWVSAPEITTTPKEVAETLDRLIEPATAEAMDRTPLIDPREDSFGYIDLVENACDIVNELTGRVVECQLVSDEDGGYVLIDRTLLHTTTSLSRNHADFETYPIDEPPTNCFEQLVAIVTGILDAGNEVR